MLVPQRDDLVWLTVADDQLNNVDAVVNFLQSEFGSDEGSPIWTSDFMRWKLGTANPAGRGFLSYAVVKDEVVGSVTLTRKRGLLNGKEIPCGEVGDTYTSASMRRRGKPAKLSELNSNSSHFVNKSIFGRLASEVFARARSQGIEIVYGTPNPNAYPGWTKKLGYTELRSCPVHCFSRPTSYLLGQHFSKLKFVSKLLGYVEQQLLNMTCIFAKFKHRDLSINQIKPSFAAIDALWNATKPDTGFSLIRDAAYWNYRYDENPIVQYEKFYFWKAGQLIGIVVCKSTQLVSGKRVFSIVEWMILDQSTLGTMIALITQKAFLKNQPGVINLWARHDESIGNKLKHLFFFKRAKVPVIFGPTPLAAQLENLGIDNFCFFIGTSDAM